MNDCPIRPAIPISLIVFGVFSVIHGLSLQVVRYRWIDINNSNDGFATLLKMVLIVSSIATFLSFCWGKTAYYGKGLV